MGFIFLFYIYYLRILSEIDAKTWDIQTVTTADFAVEVKIPDKVWKLWQTNKENKNLKFRQYLTNELE